MGKKSKGSRADREIEDDGHVPIRDSDGDRVNYSSKEKKSKGNRADRDIEDDGHLRISESDVDRVKSSSKEKKSRISDGDRVKSSSKEKKSKGSRADRDIEDEGHLRISDSDGDRVKSLSKEKKSKDSSADREIEDDHLPISDLDGDRVKYSSKEKKSNRTDRDIEHDGHLLTSKSDGGSSKSSLKEKERRRNRADREIEHDGHLLTIDSDGGSLKTSSKEKKSKRNPADREIEHDGHLLTSDSDGGSLKSSSKEKKSKRSRADREIEHDGQSLNSDSDGDGIKPSSMWKRSKRSRADCDLEGDRLKFEVVSPDWIDSHDVGSSPAKKMKKTVRFQLPEIEEIKQEEEDEVSEDDEEEVKDNLSIFDNENASPHLSDLSEGRGWQKDKLRLDLKYGFFSKKEDEKLKTAIYDVIKMKNWEESDGLQMLLKPRRYPEARGCWLDIAKCIPERPVKQLYVRAERLLGDFKRGKWSKEELEMLRGLVEKHGHNWKTIEQHLGRSAALCKDRWRVLRINSIAKKGKWSESEFDFLCAYVRWSMRIKEKLRKKKALDRRIIRDDINWEVIAEKMLRPSSVCAKMWYEKLASSLIGEGCWANGDDRRLLRSLLESGASSEEAVDWDQLLDDRDGPTCEKRWNQMKRLVYEPGAHFEDKLELVTKRYAPDLIGIEDNFDIAALKVNSDIEILDGRLRLRSEPSPAPDLV